MMNTNMMNVSCNSNNCNVVCHEQMKEKSFIKMKDLPSTLLIEKKILEKTQNLYGNETVCGTVLHYNTGAKKALLESKKKFNFRFFYRLPKLQELKICSAGFDDIKEFVKLIKPIHGYYYTQEYIDSSKPCLPYLDYEFELDSEPSAKFIRDKLDKLIDDVIKTFKIKYDKTITRKNIMLQNSCGVSSKTGKYKVSFHIIIKSEYVFESNLFARDIADELKKLHPEIDDTVYSDGHLMRMLHSAKSFDDKRVITLLDSETYKHIDVKIDDIQNYLITNIPEKHKILKVTIQSKKKLIKKKYVITNDKIIIPDDQISKQVLKLVQKNYMEEAYFVTQLLDNTSGKNIYVFNYPHTNEKCTCFTKNKHDHQGFYAFLHNNMVMIKCYSAKCSGYTFSCGNILDEIEGLEFVTKINGIEIAKIASVKKLMKELATGKIKTLCVKSSMGTGKTYLVINYIKTYDPKRILVVSTRQAFTHDVTSRLKSLNFVSYLEDKYTINEQDRVVVQLESLERILTDGDCEPFDLIVIDEIKSVMEHFDSSTITQNSENIYNLLKSLCYSEKTKLICLDADFDKSCEKYVKQFGSYKIIENEYKGIQREIVLTKNFDYFIGNVFEKVKAGKKVCICGLSSERLAEIAKKLDEIGISYIIHTRNTNDKNKKALKNVNEEWIKYQVVLFSPTITIGVDFNIEYFDYIFAMINQKSTTPRNLLQMLGRVRIIKNNTILTYVEKSISLQTDKYLYNYDDMEDYYKFLGKCKQSIIKDYECDENGTIIKKTADILTSFQVTKIYNKIEEMNKGAEYFMTQLNYLCSKKNYRLIFDYAKKEIIDPIKLDTDVIKKSIFNSPDINDKEYESIQYKIYGNNATDIEKASFKKHEFKKFWNITKLTEELFDSYYGKEQQLIKLKYILGIDQPKKQVDIVQHLQEKTVIIYDIINTLGFNLKNLDKKLTKDEFYKGGIEALRQHKNFKENYQHVRILFGKDKREISTNNSYLLQTINGLLNDFELNIKSMKSSYKNKNKVLNKLTYQLTLNKTFNDILYAK